MRWWHRNSSRRGFAINGAVVAYPDLIVMLEDGKILMVETKGDHLDNPESKAKTEAGLEWATLAGRRYRYYMVFETNESEYKGSFSFDKFIEIIKEL